MRIGDAVLELVKRVPQQRAQLPLLDLDGDGRISRSEFMAGNFSNLLFDMSSSMPAYRVQEAPFRDQQLGSRFMTGGCQRR